jgi:hypothetical protein
LCFIAVRHEICGVYTFKYLDTFAETSYSSINGAENTPRPAFGQERKKRKRKRFGI